MRVIIAVLAAGMLAGCGADTMNSAATAALLKKQEIEQGRKTMKQAQQKIAEAMKQAEQNTQQAADAAMK